MSKSVVIGSKNPVKIKAVQLGFESVFPDIKFEFTGIEVESGVSSQPTTNEETFFGADHRTRDALRLRTNGDFYVGAEGGVEENEGELHEFAWVVIRNRDGWRGKGRSCTFIVPTEIRKRVLQKGMEVGDAADIIFKQKNTKRKMGTISLLTNGVIDRTEMYRHAVVMALIPFVHPQLYGQI